MLYALGLVWAALTGAIVFAFELGLLAAAAGAGLAAIGAAALVLRRGWMLLPPPARKAGGFAVKIGVVVFLFVFIFAPERFGFREDLFQNVTPTSLWEKFGQMNAGDAVVWLSFAFVAKMAGIFSGIFRWRILLRAQGVHIPLWYMTKVWFWGRTIGLFFPGTLGLDGYRLIESSRYSGEVIKCATVLAIEKLSGFIALFTLVFLTVPLGLRVFPINLAMLGIVLCILAGFIAVCLTLLLQPRIIQVMAAVLPVPGPVRKQVNKLGAAATAYSQRRGALIAALGLGLCVHLGTVLLYFGTASAMRAPNAGLGEIFFASPLVIVATVFTPTVSGTGVREIVMTLLLGARTGGEYAFLFAHLALWIGELLPFLVSIPLLVFTTRPNRDDLVEQTAAVRAAAAHADRDDLHLTPAETAAYRGKVYATVAAGFFGGLFAGSALGLLEAAWVANRLSGLEDATAYVWGPFVYPWLFACVGLGVCGGLLFLYLLFNRFAPWLVTLFLSTAGAFGAGGLVIGLFRFQRDVLAGHSATGGQRLALIAAVAAAAVLVATIVAAKAWWFQRRMPRPAPLLGMGALGYAGMVFFGAVLYTLLSPEKTAPAFAPAAKASGPNIIMVAVDTLRADYLKAFNPKAEAVTPHIDAFAGDAVVFEKGFAQASWTKASFGSIFTGMYPRCHTAVTKTASLPADAETVAELLLAGGYYTQGYANNPNIMSVFGYGQGFVEYVDMKPSLLFGAGGAASKLSMYDALRVLRQRVAMRLPRFLRPPIDIGEFYQPADVMRETTLDWIDGSVRPKDVPFYLFIHWMDPHDPYRDPDSPDGGYGRMRMGDNPDPEVYREPMRRAYIGEIEFLDGELGKFFDGLKQRGLYDNALIVFTADHGEEFCEHGGWWHGQTLFNEQTNVPIMIKLPGNALAGTRDAEFFARNIDLAPTMLQLAGLPKGAKMQGEPLFGPGAAPAVWRATNTYAENDFEGIVLQSAQDKLTKIIAANEGNKRKLPALSVYDMQTDFAEARNRAGDPEMAGQQHVFGVILDQYKTVCEDSALAASVAADVNAETKAQLEALGYLDGQEPQ